LVRVRLDGEANVGGPGLPILLQQLFVV
jgi:hypothetical protein